MVTNEPKHQKVIEYQFDFYCKKVLKNGARDIYRETSKQNNRIILLSTLTQDQLNNLVLYETYDVDFYYFHLYGYDIKVENYLIASAIQSLPERSRVIILLFFFLELSDTQIAEELGVVRGTVYYHKQKALEKIKQYLKEHENE